MSGGIGRNSVLLCAYATREIAARTGCGVLANKSGEKFAVAARLDPGKKFAARFHSGGTT